MSKLIGYRVVIVNAVLVLVGVLRAKGRTVPDDGTVSMIVNMVLDSILSIPGMGIVNVLMRIFLTTTPAFNRPP